jgi:uncharacterized protein (DUF302 family)
MSHPSYGLTRELPNLAYETAIERTVEALKTEGFGILTRIDVNEVFKAKLDIDFRKYVILGACNPNLAHQALTAEPWIGLLLPCNVVVTEKDGGGSLVSIASPKAMFSIIENTAVDPLATDVEQRLARVLERI